MWDELSSVSIMMTQNYLNGVEDKSNFNLYISILSELWKQLAPHVRERGDYGAEVKAAFENFRKLRRNLGTIAETTDRDTQRKYIEQLMDLEENIGIVLEKLHITDFEVGRK